MCVRTHADGDRVIQYRHGAFGPEQRRDQFLFRVLKPQVRLIEGQFQIAVVKCSQR